MNFMDGMVFGIGTLVVLIQRHSPRLVAKIGNVILYDTICQRKCLSEKPCFQLREGRQPMMYDHTGRNRVETLFSAPGGAADLSLGRQPRGKFVPLGQPRQGRKKSTWVFRMGTKPPPTGYFPVNTG